MKDKKYKDCFELSYCNIANSPLDEILIKQAVELKCLEADIQIQKSIIMETRKYYWKMKDSIKIDVDDMSEVHLRNVLKLLIRRNESSAKKRCFCGAEFDGIECNSCGFDASEIDIY